MTATGVPADDPGGTLHERVKFYKDQCYNYDIDVKVHKNNKIRNNWYHDSTAKLVQKLNNDQTIKVAVVGETGTGKSMTALRIAEILHHEIGACYGDWTNENLLYEVEELLKRFSPSFEDEFTNPCFRQTLIFDEASETLGAAQYSTHFNRSVRNIIDLQRVRQNVLIFVLPQFYRLDSGIRSNIDIIIEMLDKGLARAYYQVRDYHEESRTQSISKRRGKNLWNVKFPRKALREEYRMKETQKKESQPEQDLQRLLEKKREKEGTAYGMDQYGF